MTPEEKVAFINAKSTAANIMLQGMLEDNRERRHNGYAPVYKGEMFFKLIDDFGLSHEQLISFFIGKD